MGVPVFFFLGLVICLGHRWWRVGRRVYGEGGGGGGWWSRTPKHLEEA